MPANDLDPSHNAGLNCNMKFPFENLRVVDLTDIRGAMAGRILADMGADVIKIEPPGGDPERNRAPFAGGVQDPERSLAFLYRHANKRGLQLNLQTADGRRRLDELLSQTDVLVENFGPVAQPKLGLTAPQVEGRHPHLVHVSISDFGRNGPRSHWRLEALPAFAASGALFACGFRELPPCWLPGYAAHDCASVFAAVGALVAVLDRRRHGHGQTVEVAVQEAALSGLYPWSVPLIDYNAKNPFIPAAPPRNADGNYPVVSCRDGHMRVLPSSVKQWRAFLQLLREPEVLMGPEFEDPIFRMLSGDVIRLAVGEALADRDRFDLFDEARELNVPVGPVCSPDEFANSEQTRQRGVMAPTDFPHLEGAPFTRVPFKMSRMRTAVRRPAPTLAAKNEAIFELPRRYGDPSDGRKSDGSEPILSGIRVVHFSVAAVVPELCSVLAELGAEVIKVESRQNLDVLRVLTVEKNRPNTAWTFNDACRGHRSVCLDLKSERGRDLALQLCASADIVAENYRGGALKKLGLDFDDVRRLRPDIIYVSSQGFGRDGPLGEAPSFGPLNSAVSGIHALWNQPEAPYPSSTSLNHPDHIVGKFLTCAVLGALEHRRETGEGQLIDMSQAEAGAFLIGEFYLRTPCGVTPPVASGNRVEYAVPHDVYPCASDDSWCAVAVVSDDDWQRLAACVGWEPDRALDTLAGRQSAQAEIDARLSQWTRRHTAERVATMLQDAGVSAMPVQSGIDHCSDAHLEEREALVNVEHPEVGHARHHRSPLRLSRARLVPTGSQPAPLLGNDTEDVLTRVLGLRPEDVRELVETGVCR